MGVEVDYSLVELLGLRHGDVWLVKTQTKTTVEWLIELEGPRKIDWYWTLTIEPPEGWDVPEYGFYRSHLRYGNLEALSEDEVLANFKKLVHGNPAKKYFSKNVLQNSGIDLIWVRRVMGLW